MSIISCWIVGILFIALMAAPVFASDWYVSPQGESSGDGTKESPWDISSALLGEHQVEPGDNIYLLGGTYRRRPEELFEVRLTGTKDKPVHVRSAPGERATIDGGLTVNEPSAYVWIWDLEILVSEPNPKEPLGPGSDPEGFDRPNGGLHMRGGLKCKYINLVVHDNRQGFSFWIGALDSEIHGCIIYDNGWLGTDRGHGHAIYTQNDTGIKTISDCIMTGGYGYTMHAYGSSRAYVNNYLAEGNICYNGGTFLIGGGRPSHGIRVFKNYLHNINTLQLGYSAPHNLDCVVRDNVVVNGRLYIKDFRKVTEEDNLILGKDDPRPEVAPLVVLRPNKYAPNRANLAIFNWDRRKSVDVDPGFFLRAGDRYRLMNPRDFFGKPVSEGLYTDEFISVPVDGEFAAYVLIKEPS